MLRLPDYGSINAARHRAVLKKNVSAHGIAGLSLPQSVSSSSGSFSSMRRPIRYRHGSRASGLPVVSFALPREDQATILTGIDLAAGTLLCLA